MIESIKVHKRLIEVLVSKRSWYVFNIPDVKNDINIPETTPP